MEGLKTAWGGGGGMELSEWIALWSLIRRLIRTYVCTVCNKCIKLYTYVRTYVHTYVCGGEYVGLVCAAETCIYVHIYVNAHSSV